MDAAVFLSTEVLHALFPSQHPIITSSAPPVLLSLASQKSYHIFYVQPCLQVRSQVGFTEDHRSASQPVQKDQVQVFKSFICQVHRTTQG